MTNEACGPIDMMKRIIITALLSVAAVSAALPARAVNKLEGYYELEASFQRQEQRWKFGPPGGEGMPRHYLELKMLSWPSDKLELYYKLRVQSNRDDGLTEEIEYKRPEYLSAEGHMRLHGDLWESFIFVRQNRFWINDDPLLKLVDQNKLKNDNWGPQSSGIRADFWETKVGPVSGLKGTLVYSDDGGTYNWTSDRAKMVANGTDNFILRLQKNSFGSRLEVGAMFLRKDWTNTSVGREYVDMSYNQIGAVDVSFYPRDFVSTGLSLGPLSLESSSWIAQYAVSDDPFQIATSDIRTNENKFAFAAEVRNITLKNLFFHAWYNDFGENFRDYMSYRFDDAREYNRRQIHTEAIFLVPKKAITATLTYDFYKKRIVDEEGGGLRPTTNWYGDIYIEFIKGFKSRIAYTSWHGFDASGEVYDFTTYPNWYADLSVENRLVKVRVQGRIRDWKTFRQLWAFGYDMEFNATGKLKGYFRILNVNEKTEARSTLFAQIRYDIGYGAELFLEYGNPGQSEYLVRTDYFVSEGSGDRLDNVLNTFMKIYF
jgi:hypothetical protein